MVMAHVKELQKLPVNKKKLKLKFDCLLGHSVTSLAPLLSALDDSTDERC